MVPVSTIAPAAGVPQVVPTTRPAPAPVTQAVATDLAPAKTVTAANTAQAAQNDASSDQYQHTVLLDPATQELIFRTIDVRSRQVVRQVPEEALLRMQAYAHALADGKSNGEALAQANLEI
jgi:hypothetical protein